VSSFQDRKPLKIKMERFLHVLELTFNRDDLQEISGGG
jgi:hypothetical protein